MVLLYLWYIITFVQECFSYGTAYRLTKRNGDNGVSLFGWMIALTFASMVPGLGIYLWYKYKEE